MRRRLMLMFTLTAALVAAGIFANYLLNPYGAWHSALIDPIFRKIEHERVVTPYLLRVAEPETILLGSSRVYMGMRIEQGERDGIMNAALSGATIAQLSRVVKVALLNSRLKRIVWGVDFFAFDEKWKGHDVFFDERISNNRALKFEDTLLSLSTLSDGYRYFSRARRGVKKLRPIVTSSLPWPMPMICEQFVATADHGLQLSDDAEVEQELTEDLPDYTTYRFSPKTMKLFRDTIAEARDRGVQVTMFVPLFSEYELELIRQGGQWEMFQNFKRELAATGPFWDFSGYNPAARTDALYMHIMHYKVAVGQEILRIVTGATTSDCDELATAVASSAMRVDASSIERALTKQEQMREQETRTESRYSRLVARAIERRAHGRAVEPLGSAAPEVSHESEVAHR